MKYAEIKKEAIGKPTVLIIDVKFSISYTPFNLFAIFSALSLSGTPAPLHIIQIHSHEIHITLHLLQVHDGRGLFFLDFFIFIYRGALKVLRSLLSQVIPSMRKPV